MNSQTSQQVKMAYSERLGPRKEESTARQATTVWNAVMVALCTNMHPCVSMDQNFKVSFGLKLLHIKTSFRKNMLNPKEILFNLTEVE